LEGLERAPDLNIIYLTEQEPPRALLGKKTIRVKAQIYSPIEQLLLPFLIPPCDVFWSPHYNIPFGFIRARKRVVTIHDVFHVTQYSTLSKVKKLYARLLMQMALLLSDKVITVSEFSRDEILRYFTVEHSKMSVIKNGVRQSPNWKEPEYIRNRYQLPEHYILFVGNVKPHKNIRGLLEAYLLLEEAAREKFKVVVIGKIEGFRTGDQRLLNWIKEEPMLRDRVVFTGFVPEDEIDSLYRYASLFVFPSLYEGFGLPILEAMACGTPVLTSKVSCMPEVTGGNAVLVNPNKTSDITVGIQTLLKDNSLYRKLSESGKKWAQNFTWEKTARETIGVFEKVGKLYGK